MDWTLINNRWPGKCKACNALVKKDKLIWWTKGEPIRCTGCGPPGTARATAAPDPKVEEPTVEEPKPNAMHMVCDPLFEEEALEGWSKAILWDTCKNGGFHYYGHSTDSKADLVTKLAKDHRAIIKRYNEAVDTEGEEWLVERKMRAARGHVRGLAKAVKRHAHVDLASPLLGDESESVPVKAEDLARMESRVFSLEGREESSATELTFKSSEITDVQNELERKLEHRIGAVMEGAKAESRATTNMHIDEIMDAKQAVMREVREHLSDLSIPQEIIVRNAVDPSKVTEVGVQHHKFADLCALTSAGVPTLMVGPAGGGKTTAAKVMAKAMELPFAPMSLGPQTTQAFVFGYMDATGKYVATEFRRRYEDGGVILLDELDRCNERVSVTLNASVDNRKCVFPDGVVDQHDDCYIVAAGNTTGHGADRQYVSARQQDAALIDRFAQLHWGWDEGFERALTLGILEDPKGTEWLEYVRKVRAKVEELGMRYVVSPRASIQGAKLLKSKIDVELARSAVVYRGWMAEDRKKVEASI